MKLLLPILAVAPCAAHRLRSMSSPADDGAWWAEHDGDIIHAEHRHLQSDVTHFQLKMYWEEGYFWQEEDFERRWCLECDGSSCGIDDSLHIQECDDNEDKQRFVYEEVPGTGGGRLKPYDNQELCWQRTGPNEHTLQECGTSCRQIIKGIQYIGRFEMHPNGRPDDCLEQHHHPKADEVVRASNCESSRKDTTSYWIMINKEGSTDWEQPLPPENQFTNNFGHGVCDEDYPCGLCQGHCETDDDCKSGLQCFERNGDEAVPGCLESSLDQESNRGSNFCYDPVGTYVIPPAPPTAAPTATDPPPLLTDNCEEPVTTTTQLPTTTTTTTATTTTTTTTTPTTTSTTMATTTTDPCDLSTDGSYGTKGSKVSTIDFYFELETSTSENDTVQDVVSVLERDFLRSLLPDLFGVDCAAPTRRLRGLAGVPLGASIGPGIMPVDGANCSGTVNVANNCTVFVDNMVVYSESDEDYAEFVVTRLKESMAKGEFNGSHPAIVRTTFLDQLTTEGQQEATSAAEKGGFNKLSLLYFIPGVAVVVLVVAGFVWKRRRDQRRAVDTVSVDSIPTDCLDKSHQSPARSAAESAPVSSLAIPQVHSSLVIPQVHPGRASPGPTRPALPVHTPSICSDPVSIESSSDVSATRAKGSPPPVHRSRSSVKSDAETATKSNKVPSDSTKSPDETVPVPPMRPTRAPSLENYYAHMQAQSEKWYDS